MNDVTEFREDLDTVTLYSGFSMYDVTAFRSNQTLRRHTKGSHPTTSVGFKLCDVIQRDYHHMTSLLILESISLVIGEETVRKWAKDDF